MQTKRKRVLVFRLLAPVVAALLLASCSSSRITLADMLGSWSFRNSVGSDSSAFIAPEWVILFNADNTYVIPQLSNMAMPDYDCQGDRFRMILHYPVYGTHLVQRFLWEGSVRGDDELAGRIYRTSLPQSGDARDAFSYPKDLEIGSFTARKLSD